MFGLGWSELLLILVVMLLLFGAKRLPEVARALGHSIHAFKQGMQEGEEKTRKDLEEKSDKRDA